MTTTTHTRVRRCKCSVATALTGNTGGRRMRAPHLAALLLQVKLVRVVPGLLAPETTREDRLGPHNARPAAAVGRTAPLERQALLSCVVHNGCAHEPLVM